MIIDNEEKFDTAKDELIWTKIISIFPLATNNSKTTHIVKYYKTTEDEEYYLFEYITAWNNGNIVDNFNGYHWKEVVKQIDFSDYCYIYSISDNDKNNFGLVARGKSIKMEIEKYIKEQEYKFSKI